MLAVSFLIFSIDDAQQSNDIPNGVTSGFKFSTNQSVKGLPFKHVYTPKAVIQLVKIFNCLGYD